MNPSKSPQKSQKIKLLFVCMANALRSPTFESYFKRDNRLKEKYEVRSSGTDYAEVYRLNKELLIWADRVYVMDIFQLMHFKKFFPEFLDKIEVIGVPDQYERDDERLIEIIKSWVEIKKI